MSQANPSLDTDPCDPDDPLEIPENFFKHVEQSSDNGIRNGMLMEIRHEENPDKYWIVSVTLVCGNLLRVRYVGSSTDFWCDISKRTVHHFGWCGATVASKKSEVKIEIEPPKELLYQPIAQLIDLLKEVMQYHVTVPEDSLILKGLPPLDRINVGMKVEVQNEKKPYKYWIATILKNVGGRLLLRYDTPENTANSFWMFYTNPRIRQVGFCNSQNAQYQLQYPKHLNYNKFDLIEWSTCLTSSTATNELNPFPKAILPEIKPISTHNFVVGMRLEAINPANMSEICPAYVAKVFDNYYFMVIVENDNGKIQNRSNFWLCNNDSPYIFPVGWAQLNSFEITKPPQWKSDDVFNWTLYLESTSSTAAPNNYFEKLSSSSDVKLHIGMALEAVDPENPINISVAQIIKIVDNLLLIKLEYTGKSYWYSCDSSEIFPIGWCSSNEIKALKTKVNELENKKTTENNISPLIKEEKYNKIYFNYKCYSGPLISKNKLSQLPKCVGPGPLPLVIREVLNMIISVAYKPARLLKDWEWEGKYDPNVTLECLKAKLKSSTHHADVKVVHKHEEVPSFFKEMCGKLQACPYLFGPTEITDQCPEKCLSANKSKFRKKRRRRGLHFMTIRARERRAAMENLEALSKDGVESGNESDQSLPSTSLHSESGTRPNTPDSNSDPSNKKPKRKREPRVNVPPMKTRGAKLPNFALQMKEGHWNRKDVETIYNNTCVVPRKQYSDDSESDNNSNSCNSTETKNNGENERISDVSDSEEPELKKLRVTPLQEQFQFDTKTSRYSDSSFSLQSLNNCEINPILPSDPTLWTVEDVFKYLTKYEDCQEVAKKLKEEEIDGIAFIMLNLPTMREHLKMKNEPALILCKHVASLKWLYFSQNID